jgi:hypothetical protein
MEPLGRDRGGALALPLEELITFLPVHGIMSNLVPVSISVQTI